MTKTDISNDSTSLFHEKSIDETLELLKTDRSAGLSENEAQQRLATHGPNRLNAHNRKSIFRLFIGRLQDTLLYVLLAAVVITMFMGEYLAGSIILVVRCINATLGVVQEIRAGNAIE